MYGRRRSGGSTKMMLIIGLVMAGFSVMKYFSSATVNELTGEKQYISITKEQEIALGLQSAPRMAQQHGGLHPDEGAQKLLDDVGHKLVRSSAARLMGYQFDFHLLADPRTVNAFALPGGQIFITEALFSQLHNEDQLAGVIGHEIGHVVARHSAERIAKQELTQGLTGAAVLASGDYGTAEMAAMIGNVINMKYGRDQELECDDLGVRFMLEAGYDPEQMKGVMQILKAAAGENRQPEFFSTHPNPENRLEEIDNSIKKYRSQGVGQ